MKLKTLFGSLSLLVFMSLQLASPAQADPKEFYFQRHLRQLEDQIQPLRARLVEATKAGTFQQRLNPADDSDKRTFAARYFLNSSYATAGKDSPVLYIICGEATCSEQEFRGAIVTHAKKIGAHMVALEHRYYGKSQPFAKMSGENLKYLRTEFAIEDLAAFQRYAMKELGLSGKWISVGGSYAGSLSAYYRLKHPELVSGALSSSGPVQPRANFEEYDRTVATAAGPACASAMRKVVAEIESKIDQPEELAKIKKLFDASEVVDPVDFMYVVADMAAIAVQYGYKKHFCDTLLQNQSIEDYATVGKEMFVNFGITAVQDSFQGAMSENPDDYYSTFGMRAWMYQSCTEYGYFQNAHHDPEVSVRSPRITPEYHDQVCRRLFGLKESLNTDKIQKNFYEPLLESTTSQILFTNGSDDPWANLSISRELGNNSNPHTDVFTIAGAAHCDDLGSRDSSALRQAKQLFSDLLTTWLK